LKLTGTVKQTENGHLRLHCTEQQLLQAPGKKKNTRFSRIQKRKSSGLLSYDTLSAQQGWWAPFLQTDQDEEENKKESNKKEGLILML
jgi:hypothetical protein